MNDKQRVYSRRDLIKGLGLVGLLPVAQVNKLLAATSLAPLRVLFVVLQHGWGSSNRPVTGSADDFTFPDGLDPFNSIKTKCTAIDGLLGLGEWGNNHDLSYGDILTAGVPHGEQSSSYDGHMPLSITPSLDYLLEQHSGLPSYRFSAGYNSWGVSYHPLSFDHNSTVLPFYTTASAAYNSLLKDLPDNSGTISSGSEVSDTEAELLNKVFAFVRSPAERQLSSVPLAEKEKLARYLLAVEYLKSKNTVSAGYSGSERLAVIPSAGQSNLANLDSYLDMIKVGFANKLTTSAVLGIGDINNIPDFHHSHAHGLTETWWNTRRQFSQTIVNFANSLDNVIDFDGNSLLDNTLIVLTGEVGDGGHNIINKGHLLVGGQSVLGNGRLINPQQLTRTPARALLRENRSGTLQPQIQWSSTASSRTNADLLREIGNLAGLNLTEFGLPSQNRGNVLI